MNELKASEILLGVLAIIGFIGVVVIAVLNRQSDRRTAERLIDALKEIRNDTAMLDKLEVMGVKVVPVDLFNKAIDAGVSIFTLLGSADAAEIGKQLKAILTTITDGLPNTPPAG